MALTLTHHQVPALIVNADDDPVVSARNVDENAPPLLAGGGRSRMVLLRYPAGGHCTTLTLTLNLT